MTTNPTDTRLIRVKKGLFLLPSQVNLLYQGSKSSLADQELAQPRFQLGKLEGLPRSDFYVDLV